MQGHLAVLATVCVTTVASATMVPSMPLFNTAQPGLAMPAIGLGTGGYGGSPADPTAYPECWSAISGCGAPVKTAVVNWLKDVAHPTKTGAPARLDCATSYQNQAAVGAAIKESGISRSDMWLLSKVGPSNPLGYDDTLTEFKSIQVDMNVKAVDMLLVHWPWQNPSQGNVTKNATVSSDPACQHKNAAYNATKCRLDTWRAMLKIYDEGGAKAVGVSNYRISDLQEIIDTGLRMPAANQIPFHIYRSSTQQELRDFCAKHNVTVIGYSPLGVPDWHDFSVSGLPTTQLVDPVVNTIASNHGVTPAQVLQAWLWRNRVPFNPRTFSVEHMQENVDSFSFTLSDQEFSQLSSRPNPTCDQDPWYECPTFGPQM